MWGSAATLDSIFRSQVSKVCIFCGVLLGQSQLPQAQTSPFQLLSINSSMLRDALPPWTTTPSSVCYKWGCYPATPQIKRRKSPDSICVAKIKYPVPSLWQLLLNTQASSYQVSHFTQKSLKTKLWSKTSFEAHR